MYENPPHVFAVAEEAFRKMILGGGGAQNSGKYISIFYYFVNFFFFKQQWLLLFQVKVVLGKPSMRIIFYNSSHPWRQKAKKFNELKRNC